MIPVNDQAKARHHQYLADRSDIVYCACYRFCPKDIIRSRDNKPYEVWYHYDQKKDKAYPVKADFIVFQHSIISGNTDLYNTLYHQNTSKSVLQRYSKIRASDHRVFNPENRNVRTDY